MIKECNVRLSIVMNRNLRNELEKLAKENGLKKTNDYINFILTQHVKSINNK